MSNLWHKIADLHDVKLFDVMKEDFFHNIFYVHKVSLDRWSKPTLKVLQNKLSDFGGQIFMQCKMATFEPNMDGQL